ncbi:MAG: lysine--tRNA ligase [Alphaproteobacteria bacterium]|nr:lysine--tRNA ligase [Alphaproteobacteria bacterium]
MTMEDNLGHEQRQIRLEKLKKLENQGVNAYPHSYKPDATSKTLNDKYQNLESGTETEDVVSVAGRVRAVRNSGMFIDLYDTTGKIQIYTSKESSEPALLEMLDMVDIGDIIGVTGTVRRTKRGELSVASKEITMLAKALLPLPEKFHGLTDTDTKYRHREVDMIMNPETIETLIKRSKIVESMRQFLLARGLIEVDTPILQTIKGGATAKPFITHHNTLDMDLFLRVAPELFLKRLIVGGMPGVFEFARDFRNEGIDTTHNPEFTCLELYIPYNDYNDMMDLFEEIVRKACQDVNGTLQIEYDGKQFDLSKPFARRTMADLIQEYTGIDFLAIKSDEEARAVADKLAVHVEDDADWGHVMAAVFEEKCEEHLIQPTFVMDHPKSMNPLCKTHRSEPRLVEQFEPYINGKEMGNAYTELTNPLDQRERFEAQVKAREAGDEEADMMDDDFVEALEHGLPPTGGMGIGMDRLIMFLTGNTSIRDVLAFPTMRKLK